MKVLAIDTETTGLNVHDGCKPFAVYAYDGSDYRYWVWYVDPFTREIQVSPSEVREIIRYIDSYDQLVMHNFSFDIRMLESVGVIPKRGWFSRMHDTGVMGHVVHSAKTQTVRSKLKDMSVMFLEHPKDDEKELQKAVISARRKAKKLGWNLGEVVEQDYWLPRQIAMEEGKSPDDRAYEVCDTYGCGDVLRTWSLFSYFAKAIKVEELQKPYERERQLFPVIHDMMSRGITLNKAKLKVEINKRESRIAAACNGMRKILKNDDFNPASINDLRTALYQHLRLKPTKFTKTGPSTDKEAIAGLHSLAEKDGGIALKFLDLLSIFRKNSTGRGYLTEYWHDLRNGRLFYSLKQHGTSTTRFSSQRPNAQNVGKGEDALDEDGNPIVVDSLRDVFGPRKGRIWVAMDYSQLQLRLFAFEAGEQSLIKAFRNGWDAHTFVAHKIYQLEEDEQPTKIQRRVGKAVNFGYIFGASPSKIELTAGIPGLWDTVCHMFPSATKFMNSTKWCVRNNKFVSTRFGYRLYLPYRNGKLAEHAGVNYIIQGDEGDIVKNAMILNYNLIQRWNADLEDENDEIFITLQVHDEIIYDFPDDLDPEVFKMRVRKLKRNMEKAGSDLGFETPVDVEIIKTSWGKGEKFNV